MSCKEQNWMVPWNSQCLYQEAFYCDGSLVISALFKWAEDIIECVLRSARVVQWASQVAQQIKNPSAIQEAQVWSLGRRRSPGGGHSNPLQYSCLENPVDRGAWWATVHGVAKSQTRLSDWARTESCPPPGAGEERGWGVHVCPLFRTSKEEEKKVA